MENITGNKIISEESRYLLALQRIPGFGNNRILSLIKQVGSAKKVFDYTFSQLKSIDGIGETLAKSILSFNSWELIDRILDKTDAAESVIVGYFDDFYPNQLKQIYDSPLVLWVKGDVNVLSTHGIAIVGSRNPTEYAKKMTVHFTKKAVDKKLTVFSGLAYGIDTIAHRVCTDFNAPTVSVLGSGIDTIYPASNFNLSQKIVETGGAIISEFLPGTKPDAGNFPIRNRIVSGLSLGVLVIETSEKGGSRITANLAIDQNREVFILPHALTNPNGTGNNELIKKGCGKLVQDFDDIEVELPQLGNNVIEHEQDKMGLSHSLQTISWREQPISDDLKKICHVLEQNNSHIDDIAEKTGYSTQEVLVRLLELEFQDIVIQRSGKNFFLK